MEKAPLILFCSLFIPPGGKQILVLTGLLSGPPVQTQHVLDQTDQGEDQAAYRRSHHKLEPLFVLANDENEEVGCTQLKFRFIFMAVPQHSFPLVLPSSPLLLEQKGLLKGLNLKAARYSDK